MAKYTTMKSLANALLILCLLAASCEANGLGRSASAAISPLRTASRTDSNEKVFNVLQYGAKPGGKQDSALVRLASQKSNPELAILLSKE
ncbi:hypothetical protein POTOM_035269 [Populus tomentosa]|uniref:Ankyrin repeat family protein n=1 Tax=Populus tomentosa TaxID=118781 RepID=A0A8X7Z2B9_POPTO|nr:hypothetical protein POTOM_035269 [Populus tomentosa]